MENKLFIYNVIIVCSGQTMTELLSNIYTLFLKLSHVLIKHISKWSLVWPLSLSVLCWLSVNLHKLSVLPFLLWLSLTFCSWWCLDPQTYHEPNDLCLYQVLFLFLLYTNFHERISLWNWKILLNIPFLWETLFPWIHGTVFHGKELQIADEQSLLYHHAITKWTQNSQQSFSNFLFK